MPAALTGDYRAMPLWHADVTPTTVADEVRPLPRDADVVIVGAGYCGVVAAAELARRGRSAVVLEADAIGAGASTKNGGMVIPELKHGPRWLARKHGALGEEMVRAVLDAFALVERMIEEHAIDCHYERCGGLLLAHHEHQVSELREHESEWRHVLGDEVRFVPRDQLREEIGSDAYFAGVVMERTGGLQPAKYHAGLVQVALRAGADFHGGTRATSIERQPGGGFRVSTDRGSIHAGDVLLATNAYADSLVPALRRRVLAIGSFIIATEVLDSEVASTLIPKGRMVFDTKNFLFYWRLSPDRRMVFGGRTSLAPTTVDQARDVLAREMVRVHPQLGDARIAYAWGGDVALTLDRLPHCGRLDGIAFATGCNGTGIGLATWFGVRAAAWLTGDEDAPVFARVPFRPIPAHALRAAWLPAVGLVFRARDRLGR